MIEPESGGTKQVSEYNEADFEEGGRLYDAGQEIKRLVGGGLAEPSVLADAGILGSRTEPEVRDKEFLMGAATEAGRNHKNEDSYFYDESLGVAGVFDGMGGYAGGAAASKLAKDTVYEEIKKRSGQISAQDVVNQIFPQVEQTFAERISQGETIGETTASLVLLKKVGNRFGVEWASIGDSRVYICHVLNGKLDKLSLDQNNVNHVVDEDDIPQPGKENYYYENRHFVTGGLGGKGKFKEKGRVGEITARVGDIIILTSDGIHDPLTRPEIEAVIKESYGENPQIIAQKLISAAKVVPEPRGKDDDKTAIVIKLGVPRAVQPGGGEPVTGVEASSVTVGHPETPEEAPRVLSDEERERLLNEAVAQLGSLPPDNEEERMKIVKTLPSLIPAEWDPESPEMRAVLRKMVPDEIDVFTKAMIAIEK